MGGSKLPRGVIFGWCLAAWQIGSLAAILPRPQLSHGRDLTPPQPSDMRLSSGNRVCEHTLLVHKFHNPLTVAPPPHSHPKSPEASGRAWAHGRAARAGDQAIGRATHPLAAGRSHAIPSSLCLDRRDKIGVAYCSCCSTLPPHALMPLTSPLHALHPLHSPNSTLRVVEN